MRHTGLWLTMSLAVVVGVVAGVALFTGVGPIPLPNRPASTSRVPSDPASESGTPSPRASSSAPPSASSSPSRSESGTRTATPSAATSATSEPPFTARALLQPAEFLERGWGSATVSKTWTQIPPVQVTSCAAPADGDGAIVAAHAATYRGRSTTAAEVVARYDTEKAAQDAVQTLIDRIAECADPADGEPDLTVEPMQVPDPDGISEVYLWNTTGPAGTSTEGAIGVARAGDRIALLSMVSTTTDPVGTTKVGSLVLQAGRRLV